MPDNKHVRVIAIKKCDKRKEVAIIAKRKGYGHGELMAGVINGTDSVIVKECEHGPWNHEESDEEDASDEEYLVEEGVECVRCKH